MIEDVSGSFFLDAGATNLIDKGAINTGA